MMQNYMLAPSFPTFRERERERKGEYMKAVYDLEEPVKNILQRRARHSIMK